MSGDPPTPGDSPLTTSQHSQRDGHEKINHMGTAAHQNPNRRRTPVWRRPATLGVDVGGVLVERSSPKADTSFFGQRPMDTPAVAGALDAVRSLVTRFEYRVHIVSRASTRTAGITRAWLATHGMLGGTGIPDSNVHFVARRPDKHDVCARMGITHFIDDRLEVLQHLDTVEHRYLFTGALGEHDQPPHVPSWATLVDSWDELLRKIETDLDT